MMMVEYFANSSTCAFGDFACALGGADADVLARDGAAFADIAGSIEWVKRHEVAGAFAHSLGRCSGALAGSFADVSRAPADVATGAALMGLLPGCLRCCGRLRFGLRLVVLTGCILAAEFKCECGEGERYF
jgi:hypothetical protein